MFEVPIAHVGVVIAYLGSEGKDVTGELFRHGNLVSKGEKGCGSSRWIQASIRSTPTRIKSATFPLPTSS